MAIQNGIMDDDLLLKEFMLTILTIQDLREGRNDVILGIADAALNEKMQKRTEKEFKLKEDTVKKVHVTQSGNPRTISEKEDEDGRTYYFTKVKGKKQFRSYTYSGLINKLYDYYKTMVLPEETENTLACIFRRALDAYKAASNPSPNTVYKYEKDFKRFLEGSPFAQKNICQITALDIQTFTQAMVNKSHPKLKAFLGYIGLLNLIFRYARTIERLIPENPMDLVDFAPYKKSCDQTRPKSDDKILSSKEIERIREVCRNRIAKDAYYVRGYMILLAIESGMRVGELCSLKWDDVKWDVFPNVKFEGPCIHIHSQLLSNYDEKGKLHYTYVGWTKDEKGISRGGRYYPLTGKIRSILTALKENQKKVGAYDPDGYVFLENDKWITTISYEKCLKRMCRSLGYEVTNNHALRMSLNSNLFIPRGIPVTTRALWLGHSVEVNLNNYSYAEKKPLSEYTQKLDEAAGDQDDDWNGKPVF